jgi:hypothetical protein
LKDIVVPLEPTAEATDHNYALLGAYLLRISCTTDAVEIWRSGRWLRFGLTGEDVRGHAETILLTVPALHSLVK